MLSRDTRLISVKEAASILNMNEQVIYRQVRQGIIPAYRVGTSVRIDLDEFQKTAKIGAEENEN